MSCENCKDKSLISAPEGDEVAVYIFHKGKVASFVCPSIEAKEMMKDALLHSLKEIEKFYVQ